MLHVACCILHVACCMLHAACCMLSHVACRMSHVACRMSHVACCILPREKREAMTHRWADLGILRHVEQVDDGGVYVDGCTLRQRNLCLPVKVPASRTGSHNSSAEAGERVEERPLRKIMQLPCKGLPPRPSTECGPTLPSPRETDLQAPA